MQSYNNNVGPNFMNGMLIVKINNDRTPFQDDKIQIIKHSGTEVTL